MRLALLAASAFVCVSAMAQNTAADIAAWLDKADVSSNVAIEAPLTAIYQNGDNLYVTDSSNHFLWVKGELTSVYGNGNVIPAGASGKYVSGLTGIYMEADPTTFLTSTSNVEPVAAKEMALSDVAAAEQSTYAKLADVTITTDGKKCEKDDASVKFNNLYNIEIPTDGGRYDVIGFTGALKMFVPVEITPVSEAPVTPVINLDIISTRPEGKYSMFTRDGVAFIILGGGINQSPIIGQLNEFVEAENGVAYLSNPLPFYRTQNWVKGEVKDGYFIITGPQCIKHTEGSNKYMCITAMEEITDPADGMKTFVPTETQQYRFKINEDGSFTSADEGILLGLAQLTMNDDGSLEKVGWAGFGDQSIVMKPVNSQPVEAPAGTEFTTWTSPIDYTAREMKVGIDGSDIYIAGFYSDNPEAMVKGTIDGDKAIFPSKQFLGINQRLMTFAWFMPANGEEVYNEQFESFEIEYTLADNLVFAYDADKGTLSTDQYILINMVTDQIQYKSVVSKPYLSKSKHISGTRPANPYIQFVNAYDGEYGSIRFNVPDYDTDYAPLDNSNLYWQLIFDDEVFVFYNDEYPEIEDELSLVPYNFTDYSGIDINGSARTVYFYVDVDKYAVQTVYIEPETGNKLYSDVVEFGDVSAIDEVSAEKAVESVIYHDLQGRRISQPAAGMYIRTVVFADKTIETTKVVITK